jgi:hypothetical protein
MMHRMCASCPLASCVLGFGMHGADVQQPSSRQLHCTVQQHSQAQHKKCNKRRASGQHMLLLYAAVTLLFFTVICFVCCSW